jgi:hypothetical protein
MFKKLPVNNYLTKTYIELYRSATQITIHESDDSGEVYGQLQR